jgi:hypothetical protein
MTRDHGRIEELLAVRVLDGLDGDDVAVLERELAAHGPACDECTRIQRELSEVAGYLAFALVPVPVDASIADRVIATEPAVRAGDSAAPRDELAARRTARPSRAWTGLVGVAAVLALLAFVVTVVRPGTQPITSANLAQRVVHFEGDAGRLAMAFVPGETGVVFWGTDLPDPGPEQVYEIWMIDGEAATPGGCVRPVDGRLAVYVEADVGATDLMAVTVEPASCPTESTAEGPVLTAPL